MTNAQTPMIVLLLTVLIAATANAQRYNATHLEYKKQYNDTAGSTGRMAASGNWSGSQPPNEDDGEFRNHYSATVDAFLGSASVLYGLLGQSSPVQVSTVQCHNHLMAMYEGIHRRDVWAMKMLDASATAQPGFVWGNNYWLGSRKQCESIQYRKHITLSPRFERNMKPNLVDARAPFDVGYRIVHAQHASPWQVEVEFLISAKILHLGLCVPSACNNRDIHRLTQTYLDSGTMEAQNLFVHQAQVLDVKDLALSADFFAKRSVKIVGAFVLITVLLVSVATLYEPRARRASSPILASKAASSIGGQTVHQSDKPQTPSSQSLAASEHNIERSVFKRFVTCFSLRSNIPAILSTEAPPSALPTVNAFKSIGCFLILNFHLAWFSYYTVNNGAEVFVLGEELQWQWLSTAPLIVDIFFAISGMLLAYNFLRNEKQVHAIRTNSVWANCRLFGRQFVHRYLRLTPLYMFVVGGTEIATAYLAEKSPFWMTDRNDLTCQRNWWRNFLYIQNFYDVEEICLNWTWSLACEMQFFLAFTVLLFVYVRQPAAAKWIYCGAVVAFTLCVTVISWRLKFTPAYDVLHDLGTELYTVPWVRVLPYMIGVGAGWYLHESAGQPLPWSHQTTQLLWTLATTVMTICHLITFVRNISYVIGVPMIVGVRLFYGGSACWMIVASVKGHGGWFTRAMNLPVFVHLNKLSYGIYLLNPIVISVIYGAGDHSTAIEPIVQITTSVGIMVIVYLMSFACSLLFELPYTKLSAEILRGCKQKVM